VSRFIAGTRHNDHRYLRHLELAARTSLLTHTNKQQTTTVVMVLEGAGLVVRDDDDDTTIGLSDVVLLANR
jgi:hypothetical protein